MRPLFRRRFDDKNQNLMNRQTQVAARHRACNNPSRQDGYAREEKMDDPEAAGITKELVEASIGTVEASAGRREMTDKYLRYSLWFSICIGWVLVGLALLSSWLLWTVPELSDHSQGVFDMNDPQDAAVIDAAWGLVYTIIMLMLHQVFLTVLSRRLGIPPAKTSEYQDQDPVELLLRMRVMLGSFSIVILFMAIMFLFSHASQAAYRGVFRF